MRLNRFISHASAICVVAITAGVASNAKAAVVFSTSQGAFLSANGGLTLETFESANVAAGTDTAVAGPINSVTNNAVFAASSLAAGFTLTPTAGDVYVARDVGGNPGAVVSSNFFAENMNIGFGPAVTAIGIDLLQWFGNDGGWALEIYDTADTLLGSFATAAGSFVGITSDVAIGRLFLNKPDSGAVIDNLRFGSKGASVPEPSTLLLVGLAGLALRTASRGRATLKA